MNILHDDTAPLPASIDQAIQRLIDETHASDVPILDVTASAARLAGDMPEAAALGPERLRHAIAEQASRDSRVGLSIDRAA